MTCTKANWMTVSEALLQRTAKSPDRIALVHKDYRMNWQDVDRFSDRIAWYLYGQGVRKGRRISLWGFNSVYWILTFLALQKLGAQAVLFNPHLVETELKELIDYAEPEAVCALDAPRQLPSLHGERPYRLYTEKDIRMAMQLPTTPEERHRLESIKRTVVPEDILGILFTSGTTSRAKGAMLRQGDVVSVAFEAAEQMHWDAMDSSCMALPLFHCFGLSAGYLTSLATGHCVCLVDDQHSEGMLETIEKYQCTIMNGVPTMFLAILRKHLLEKHDVSSLKSGIVAGSLVSEKEYMEISHAFGFSFLAMSYGQTEASPSVTFSPYEDLPEKIAQSVGKVLPSLSCRIVDIRDHSVLDCGKTGEIELSGYHIFPGYFRMEEATARAMTADGWLRTGDLGYLDADGYLYVTGRRKEMIIRCGENISCTEIEQAIQQYPGVHEVKVLGLPSPVTQEEIAACIVTEGDRDEKHLRGFLSALLAHYKIPRYLLFMEELPRTANGKIKIGALKEQLLKHFEGGKS